MKRAPFALLLVFCIVFVMWRLAFLAWSEYIYDEEEAKTGSISVILMDGPKLPILEHQPGDYEGGTLLFGILAIPFMWIVGKPYLGLKLLALTTSLLLALFSVLWIRKLAGNVAAWFCAVLWLCAVPYILQVGFIPWGNYAETAMLTVITFYLLHTILFERKRGWWRFALLGLFFGIGTWMHYGYMVTGAVCLLIWFLADARLFFTGRFLATIAGGIVGFLPWIIYNVTHSFWGLGRFADGVRTPGQSGKAGRIISRLWSLFTEDLPCSLHLIIDGVNTTRILSYVFYLVFIGLLVAMVVFYRKNLRTLLVSFNPKNQRQSNREKIAVFVPVLYFFGYAFIFCLSEYGLFSTEWGSRDPETHVHIFVMLPAMIWISSIGAAKIYEQSHAGAIAPVALLCILGIAGQFGMLDFDKSQTWRLSSTLQGEKKVIYMEIGSKWGRKPQDIDRIASRLDGIDLYSFYFGAGITYGLDHVGSIQVAFDKCAALKDAFLPYCWFGIGTGLASSQQLKTPELDNLIVSTPKHIQPYLIAGGAVGAIWFGQTDHPYLDRVQSIDFTKNAPEGHEKDLPSFIQGHLDMLGYRPKKD